MGQESDKALIEAALSNLLDPIAAMLLRNGVTFQEFTALAKGTYVAVAQRDFGVRGRPTNTAKVSALTGIDRKEVKRLKDLLAQGARVAEAREGQDKMSRVVRGWYEDPEFLNEQGHPAHLLLDDGTLSFKELARRYSGGLPFNVVLKELIRAGNVVELDGGALRVLKPFYTPPGSDPQAMLRAGTVINELANTLLHNLYLTHESPKKTLRFERRASSNHILAKDAQAFKDFLNHEGQAFLERVAQWIVAHQIDPNAQPPSHNPTEIVRLGVGVYGIESPNQGER
ncbi:DUF6502 family protein [Marinagarivorans algicola]|uniref:DUF6502 family protein n=1 Tax=Marinagarivorans algicola TaxID=1513270 RepID=UPI0006B48256|nr:DUF6502 family protein [Marinagarivorans algicola]